MVYDENQIVIGYSAQKFGCQLSSSNQLSPTLEILCKIVLQ